MANKDAILLAALDSGTGLDGARQLWLATKSRGVTLKQATEFLRRDPRARVFTEAPVKPIYSPILVSRPMPLCELDLIDHAKIKTHRGNRGFAYVRVATDDFTKRVWTRSESQDRRPA
jgi:hypothetical protein